MIDPCVKHCTRSWNLINNKYVTVKIVNLTLLCNVFVKSFKMTSLVKMRTLLSKNEGKFTSQSDVAHPKKIIWSNLYSTYFKGFAHARIRVARAFTTTQHTHTHTHTHTRATRAFTTTRHTHTYIRTHTHTTRLHNIVWFVFFSSWVCHVYSNVQKRREMNNISTRRQIVV